MTKQTVAQRLVVVFREHAILAPDNTWKVFAFLSSFSSKAICLLSDGTKVTTGLCTVEETDRKWTQTGTLQRYTLSTFVLTNVIPCHGIIGTYEGTPEGG